MKTSIRVRVPATTANVGPGFDTLGIALKLYNEVELELASSRKITLRDEIHPPSPRLWRTRNSKSGKQKPKFGQDLLAVTTKRYGVVGQDLQDSEIRSQKSSADYLSPLSPQSPRLPVSQSLTSHPSALRMIEESADLFFYKARLKTCGFEALIRGEVPVARGLGSSVTVRLGIVAGLNGLLGSPFDKQGLLELVAELEGHPDNAAPAVYGGLVVSGAVSNHKGTKRIATIQRTLPAALKFVAVIPDFEVQTGKARRLLPGRVPFSDAVHNVNRAALLVAAWWNGDYLQIGDFLDDRLHQPARSKLVPQLFPALDAAKRAGAIGGWLSGSGSSVIALTLAPRLRSGLRSAAVASSLRAGQVKGRSNGLARPSEIGRAMQEVFQKENITCEVRVMEVDNTGIRCR